MKLGNLQIICLAQNNLKKHNDLHNFIKKDIDISHTSIIKVIEFY